MLPVWVHRIDTLKLGLRSNVWVQARGRPIRGWLLQQLVKLAMVEWLSADVIIHADSDVVLLRPLTPTSLIREGRVRLYERPAYVDETLPNHLAWHRSAERLLELPRSATPAPDFISGLVPWKRENALGLLDRISETTGKHWLRALAEAWHVSEYTLYGRFVRDVLGPAGGQFVAASPLCLDYYKRVPLSGAELSSFLELVDRETIAASFTSKAGMDPSQYVEILERHWASTQPAESQDEAAERTIASDGTRGALDPGARSRTSRSRTPRGVRGDTGSRSTPPLRGHPGLTVGVLGAWLMLMFVVVLVGLD